MCTAIRMRLFRSLWITALLGLFLAACRGPVSGLEKEWERKEEALLQWEGCIHVHPRSPSTCSSTRAAYEAALKAYKAAASSQPK